MKGSGGRDALSQAFALDRATARVERRLTKVETRALDAQALLESLQVPELAVPGLVQPPIRRGPMPGWLGTALPEGELQ